jgi:hypothetical protein
MKKFLIWGLVNLIVGVGFLWLAYSFLFDLAPSASESALGWEKLAVRWAALDNPEQAVLCIEWAALDREMARNNMINGFLYGVSGIAFISLGIHRLVIIYQQSRHDETKI